jgi:hypothetical protein
MAKADAPTKEEKKGTERVESAISKSPSDPSPFLKELSSITGPSQARTMAQLDKDGFGTRAEGLEAQKIMSDLHSFKSNFGYGQITKDDIQKYGDQSTNPAEKALAKRLQDHFTQISADGKVISQGDITKYLGQEQNKADMRNLHAKDANGKTLLDSVGDGKGGVSGDKLDKKLADPNLTAADRASLERLNGQRDSSWGSKVGDVTADQVKKMDENAGLKPEDLSKLRKQAEPQSADQQRTEAALKDLTAKPGGGQSLLDKVGNGKGGVDESKVSEFLAHPERHNLTDENKKTLQTLNDQIQQNQFSVPNYEGVTPPRMDLTKGDLQKMGADAGVNFDKIAANASKPAEAADQKQREQQFGHLFDKQNGKPSLYDQIKSPDGGITGANLDKALSNPNLSAADRASLSYLKNLQDDGTLYGKKDFTKDDIAAKAHQHNMSDAALKKAGIDTTPKPAEVAPTPANGDLKQEGHKALVVHSGQGYYHVAERLLSEAHKGDKKYEPSQKELKELVSQLQHANGNRKSLNSKEELKIDDAIKHNPALAGLFA